MARAWLRVPLAWQVGVVAALTVASLAALGATLASVVRREGRRESIGSTLERAGRALARDGAGALAEVPRWPATLSHQGWRDLERRLSARTAAALAGFEGVEGGFYVPNGRGFLGTAPPAGVPQKEPGRWASGPPPREADMIETMADAAVRKNEAIFAVLEVPPSTVAIRTAPLRSDGRVVGAAWVMTRPVDPVYLDRSLRGYLLAAGLALGGIGLALGLTLGLTRSLRREAEARRKLEVELRRSERLAVLGKMLAGVAHEVRNPLAGIRAITQLWRRGLGRDDEAFGHLIDEVDRLELIVSRLLQFSRADAQELAPGDLNAVVAEAARLAADRARDQGVRVELDLAHDLPAVEMAAPALIQVLRNLTTNALQVMPDGGTLRLATRRGMGHEGAVAVVSDTGPGLAPEVQQHLFEPFFTTKAEGTGLGLAIAREIALAHRGTLHAANRPDGPGASFALELPAAHHAPVGAERR